MAHRKVIAWLVVAAAAVVLFADRISAVLDLPDNLRTLSRVLSEVFDMSYGALAFFFVLLLALAIATAEWWLDPARRLWAEIRGQGAIQSVAAEDANGRGSQPTAASPSVLTFVSKSEENHTFRGGFGADLHVPAVIKNNDRKSAYDVHVDLIRISRINEPGQQGQPYIQGLPRRLVSDKGNEFETIAPEREQAFALCAKHEELDRDAVLVLAPGSKGAALPVLPPGSYFLHVVVSARDTPPTRQAYKVDVSHLKMGYRLCTPDEVLDPSTIPVVRTSTSVVQLSPPEYEEWDKRNMFRLWEAACLWADEEPARPLSAAARKCLNQLAEAIYSHELDLLRNDDQRQAVYDSHMKASGHDVKPDQNWMLRRQRLLEYASSIGTKPPFLYPSERA